MKISQKVLRDGYFFDSHCILCTGLKGLFWFRISDTGHLQYRTTKFPLPKFWASGLNRPTILFCRLQRSHRDTDRQPTWSTPQHRSEPCYREAGRWASHVARQQCVESWWTEARNRRRQDARRRRDLDVTPPTVPRHCNRSLSHVAMHRVATPSPVHCYYYSVIKCDVPHSILPTHGARKCGQLKLYWRALCTANK